jgi:hypothetical protein
MAAGLGFKDFVTGEVLTAADVDGYLMQGVWVFASAAARDAAVTSPQEGNFAYLKDTNVTTYYTGSAWANLDTTGMTNPMTTTGDTIYSSSGSTPARLAIGSTGNVLTVAGGVPTWAAPAGSSGPSFGVYGSAAQTGISNATFTKVALNTELWDTDSCYDTSTYRFTPNKAGYYQINANIQTVMSPVDLAVVAIYKNGAEYTRVHRRDGVVNFSACSATLVYLNGTTDYIEFFAYIASTTTRNIELDSGAATTGVWIRS